MMRRKIKRIRVPIKDIELYYHELLIINTPTFQRLYKMNQLGLAYMVYPFATHTRAAHSLDTLNEVQKIIDCLDNNLRCELEDDSLSIDRKTFIKEFLKELSNDSLTIRLAALLHDIAHIPYSHSLEDENPILEKHDKSGRIDQILSRLQHEVMLPDDIDSLYSSHLYLGFNSAKEYIEAYENIIKLLPSVSKALWTIAGSTDKEKILPPGKHYIADLIGNTICADLLSYIRRDVDFTGIETRAGGSYRLMDYFDIGKDDKQKTRVVINLTKKGELRTDVITAIAGLLNARFSVTEQITFHHAKCAASAMLGKICRLIKLNTFIQLPENEMYKIKMYKAGDEGMIELLSEILEKAAEPEKISARALLNNLKSRRFYKRVGVFPYGLRGSHFIKKVEKTYIGDDDEKRNQCLTRIEKIEIAIEKDLHLPIGSVIVFCPKVRFKEVKTLVKYETYNHENQEEQKNETIITSLNSVVFKRNFKDLYRFRIKAIEDQYNTLKRLYVFLDPKYFKLYAAAVIAKIEEYIPGFEWDRGLKKYLEGKESFGISDNFYKKINETITEQDIIIRKKLVNEFYELLPQVLEVNADLRKSLSIKNIDDIIKVCYKKLIERRQQIKIDLNDIDNS